MKFYYQKYHLFFYAGRPLYNTYYFSIRQALPIFWLKIDFWGIMPINLGGYNPHMALGPMGQKIGKAYPNYSTLCNHAAIFSQGTNEAIISSRIDHRVQGVETCMFNHV